MHKGKVVIPEQIFNRTGPHWSSQDPWGEIITKSGSVDVLMGHPNHPENLKDVNRNLIVDQEYYKTKNGDHYYCYGACCGAVFGIPVKKYENFIRVLADENDSPFNGENKNILVFDLIPVTKEEFDSEKKRLEQLAKSQV